MVTLGPIETEIRKKHLESSPLVELAAKLAEALDAGDGSVAMVKELRSILKELSPEAQWAPSVSRSPALDDLEPTRWSEKDV
jgi:hypothetical protein